MNLDLQDLYERYRQLAVAAEQNNAVYFVGRLANYKYMNMDEAILNALTTFDRVHPDIMNQTRIITPSNTLDLLSLTQKDQGTRVFGSDATSNTVSVITAMPRGSSTAWLHTVIHPWCESYSVPPHAEGVQDSSLSLRFVVYTPVNESEHRLDQQELHTLRRTLATEFGNGRCRIDIVPLHDSRSTVKEYNDIPPKPLTFYERAVLRFLLTASGEAFGAANVFLPWAAGKTDSRDMDCVSCLAGNAARIAHAKTHATLDTRPCRHEHGENVSALLSGYFRDAALSRIDGPHFYSDGINATFEAFENMCDAQFPVLTFSEPCLRQVLAQSLERLVILGQLPSAVGVSNL